MGRIYWMPGTNVAIGRNHRVKARQRLLAEGVWHHWVIHWPIGQGWRLCVWEVTLKKQNKKHIHTLQPHWWPFNAGFHEREHSITQIQTICWCLQGDLVDFSLPSIREELRHWLIQDRSWLRIRWVNFYWRWRQHWLHVHHGRPTALMAILGGKGKTVMHTASYSPALLQITATFWSKLRTAFFSFLAL